MVLDTILSVLPRWAENRLESPWTYIVLMTLFTAILIVTLWRLLKHPAFNKRRPAPNQPSDSKPIQENDLAALVLSLRGSCRKVLLAAAGLDCMPVTIPIRLALNLAAGKQRCLLIDLDTRRDAIARAFEIPLKNPPSFEPVATDVEHIHVIAAHVFANSQTMSLQTIIRSAEKRFNVILLSAPYLDGNPDRKQIAASADYTILFAETDAQIHRLESICHAAGGRIIGRYRTNRVTAAKVTSPSQ